MFEAAQPTLDLARGGEQVTDLSRELRDLVADMVQQQRAGGYQGSAVLEHCFDLGHERVVDLQRLGGSQCRFGQQCPSGGDRVDGVCLAQPTRAALSSRARRRDLAGVKARRGQRDRHMRSPLR